MVIPELFPGSSLKSPEGPTDAAAAAGEPEGVALPTTLRGWLHEFWREWSRQGRHTLLLMATAMVFLWFWGMLPGDWFFMSLCLGEWLVMLAVRLWRPK